MLAAPAHSFAQHARLAVSLSWIGGWTNAITIIACAQVTSHMTGAVSQAGVAVAEGAFGRAAYLVALVTTFVLGATAAGLLLEVTRIRRWSVRFALPIGVEAGLLTALAWPLATLPAEARTGALLPTLLAAFAMGLQNATITRISGGVVRTTHVTGVATDLGLDLARDCARRLGWLPPPSAERRRHGRQRLLLLASIPASFALGAGLGTVAFERWPAVAMVPPVVFLLLLLALQIGHHRAMASLAPLPGPAPGVLVFVAQPPPGASEFVLPDLIAWASHLDRNHRVLLLDLSKLPAIDAPAAFELRALSRHHEHERRHLVLCGLEEPQLQTFDDAGVLFEFDADDLCHDRHAAELRAAELLAGELSPTAAASPAPPRP